MTTLEGGGESARVTSRLEFWRYPDLMAQFPFPHTLEMTYRLANGAVDVETVLDNHGRDPMPVAVGYHLISSCRTRPRDRWKVHLAAREHLLLSSLLIPTGEKKPVEFPDPYPLAGSATRRRLQRAGALGRRHRAGSGWKPEARGWR